MNDVILKGSSLDIVLNRDLDEYKSPAGSRTKINKADQGNSKLIFPQNFLAVLSEFMLRLLIVGSSYCKFCS